MFINQNNAQAVGVMAAIYALGDAEMYYFEPYLNGRENGFAITFRRYCKIKLVFSEYRNSDSIVVYWGDTIDFSMQGNCPSEEVYNRKHFFNYLDFEGAARFILAKLEEYKGDE